MSEATKGPYEVEPAGRAGQPRRNIVSGGMLVARVGGSTFNEVEANTILLAASWEMRKALEAALKDADWGLEDGDQLPPWVEEARAALRKAGEGA